MTEKHVEGLNDEAARVDGEAVHQPVLTERDHQHLAAFDQLRNLLRDRTRSVAKAYQNGTYIVGRPGSSKTFTIIEELKALDVPYVYRNARMTAPGLWNLLREHPEGVVVLDDIPSLVAEKPAQMVLLAALGGEPGKPRRVTYTTAEVDGRKSFEFRGGIIAISNVPLRRDPLADAVQSRVPLLEHEPTDDMLAAFMREQALKGFDCLTATECMEVVEFIINECRASEYRLDLRSMSKAWGDYLMCKRNEAHSAWRDLVRSSLKLTFPAISKPLTRRDQKGSEQEIAAELFKQFPGRDQAHHREQQWKEQTGKSVDSLYRRQRELRGRVHKT